MSVTESVPRLSQAAYPLFRQVRLGAGSKTLKLDARPLDHLLQVEHKLAIHRIISSPERVQRCRAGSVENPEHAQLLKAAFVDTSVFLSCGGQNNLDLGVRFTEADTEEQDANEKAGRELAEPCLNAHLAV